MYAAAFARPRVAATPAARRPFIVLFVLASLLTATTLASAAAEAQAPVPVNGAPAAGMGAGDSLQRDRREGDGPPASAVRTMRATHALRAPRLDGVLDESIWRTAEVGSDFRQTYPDDGKPATERTDVRIAYDDVALYVGVRLWDRGGADSIAAQLARRDATNIYSDWAHVIIDSYHDRRTGFRFSVNPKGVQKDVRHFDDTNEDLLWDAVWQVATRVDSAGWTAEYRIPFSQLRFSNSVGDAGRVWGLNVQRDIARRGERSSWSYTPRTVRAFVSRFGELRGLDSVPPPGKLEILPYISSTLTRDTVQALNPFYRRNAGTFNVGADFKYGVTPGLTLNATANPDFGQVELDPAVVNLSQFENFFDERRPFFVEGADLYRFGETRSFVNAGFGDFFYSRRIGRAPQRAPGEADVDRGAAGENAVISVRVPYSDVPALSTILGAAKLSGKTAGGWSVGVLDAVTARETARFRQEVGFVDAVSGDTLYRESEGRAPVEPLTNYFVSRARRDLRGGRSVVGGMLTSVNRRNDDPVFSTRLRNSAMSGGVDFDHTWGDRRYSVSGFLSGSRIAGSEAVITAAQRAPARYFQRPDNDYRDVDTTRTLLAGYAGALALTKTSGTHVVWSLDYRETSPGFEVNDIGFQQVADRRALSALAEWAQQEQTRRFRGYNFFGLAIRAQNFGGLNTQETYVVGARAELRNFWSARMQLRGSPSTFNDRLTRGGPVALTAPQLGINGNITSDSRRRVIMELGGNVRADSSGGYDRGVELGIEVRPASFIRVTFQPGFGRSRSTAQFLTSAASATATGTFGRRYIFSDVETTEFASRTRVNWTFTPRLSLEVVARPFISANRFSNYKQLRAARTFTFDRFGQNGFGALRGSDEAGYVADPDGVAGNGDEIGIPRLNFTQRSLRGSAVLRWEYRPGSALFFVWQQTRDGVLGTGDFDAGRDVRGIFGEQERSVFAIKGTYWIAR